LGTAALAACCLFLLVGAGGALADSGTTSYSATQTVSVPPVSTFPGSSGGGDGWAVALSDTQVFNVFHHNTVLGVECHNQADGSTCWPNDPTFITDGSGNQFLTSGQPGIYLDQTQGKLYVYAERAVDGTAGVVCVDVSNPTADPTFCGFTPLTNVGEASLGAYFSSISSPMHVGNKLYSFNYYSGAGVTGTENTLMCFDLTTDAACAGQPYTVDLGLSSNAVVGTSWPAPTTVAIDGKLFIPMLDSTGNQTLACWDPATGTNCAGSWPISLNSSGATVGSYGGPFPMLDGTGNEIGLCLPAGNDSCFDFTGASATTPVNLPSALSGGSSVVWNGGGVIVGPRVYIPQWDTDVTCFDFSTGDTCAGFPKYFNGLGLLYTVNPDPQRPTCLWVNSDNGSDQIQNFDAFGGNGCGSGPIRVLVSQFVVPQQACFPTTYQSLQITDPPASAYQSGATVSFEDGDGNPIADAQNLPIQPDGTVDLSGIADLNGPLGLPQFLVSLTPTTGTSISSVTVKLSWTATYNTACDTGSQTPTPTPVTTTTQLSGGGATGSAITVSAGTSITDQATLTGTDVAAAGGTVTYTAYSDNACSVQVGSTSTVPVTNGAVPASGAVTVTAPGTYYWVASYSGDPGNAASSSTCGSETATVPAPVTTTTTTTTTAAPAAAPPAVAHCVSPSGAVAGLAIGPFTLGMTQQQARTTIYHYNVTRNQFDNFCLYHGWGIRLGYPTGALLTGLPAADYPLYFRRVVIGLTANPFYSLNGATPGTAVSAVTSSLHLGKPFHVGRNYWYFVADGQATGVLKVRAGVIQEVGLATRALTTTRAQQRVFIRSFDEL
jgi:hypothetical protein